MGTTPVVIFTGPENDWRERLEPHNEVIESPDYGDVRYSGGPYTVGRERIIGTYPLTDKRSFNEIAKYHGDYITLDGKRCSGVVEQMEYALSLPTNHLATILICHV